MVLLDTGREDVHRNGDKVTKEVDEELPYEENENKKEAHFCDGSPLRKQAAFFFFESRHCYLLNWIRRRCEQSCSMLEEARKQRMEQNRVNGEYEAMLNSSLGKVIIDTGCAKLMTGSDTFKQCLGLLVHPLRKYETRMTHWSAVILMNIGKHVCREKVAIILGDCRNFNPSYPCARP